MSRLDVSGGLARPLLFLAGGFWAIEAVALLGALGMGSSPRNMRDTRTRKRAPKPLGRAPLSQWALTCQMHPLEMDAADYPGLQWLCATPCSIMTQGCFSEHHMCTPGFTHDGSSSVPALRKVRPE